MGGFWMGFYLEGGEGQTSKTSSLLFSNPLLVTLEQKSFNF